MRDLKMYSSIVSNLIDDSNVQTFKNNSHEIVRVNDTCQNLTADSWTSWKCKTSGPTANANFSNINNRMATYSPHKNLAMPDLPDHNYMENSLTDLIWKQQENERKKTNLFGPSAFNGSSLYILIGCLFESYVSCIQYLYYSMT